MQVGDHRQYIYKQYGKEYTVDAEILSIHGNEIRISFLSHNGSPRIRSLRSAQERARLVDYRIARPGAPNGNQNAAKEEMHRIAFPISLSDTSKHKRLSHAYRRVKEQGLEPTPENLRTWVYSLIDADMDTSPE